MICFRSLFHQRHNKLFGYSTKNSYPSGVDYHKLPRLFHPQQLVLNVPVEINQEDNMHYMLNVMRMKEGSLVRLFNPGNGEFVARMIESPTFGSKKRRKIYFQLLPFHQFRPSVLDQEDCHVKVAMFIPIIKKDRLKYMVEKLTELGVNYIIPIVTQNTEHNINDSKQWNSMENILIQASEQCERLDIPSLCEPRTIDQLCTSIKSTAPVFTTVDLAKPSLLGIDVEHFFICKERSINSTTIVESLNQWKSMNGQRQNTCVGCVIGPEGGWTQAELELLGKISKVSFVSLGCNVLRSETAALMAMGCASLILNS
jgi:16S rRNA (uracil1498-N3)-methyltransferase